VFLTTHYLEEAEQADRICVIDHGHIVAYGTPFQLKAQMTEDYLLIDALDRDALRAELTRAGVAFTEVQGLIRIDASGARVHRILKAIETPLSVVQTHTPTLEDAYLQIIHGAEDA
jgi:ABC-2 type transport system ATP-binding protein